jgi:hypothetical protein
MSDDLLNEARSRLKKEWFDSRAGKLLTRAEEYHEHLHGLIGGLHKALEDYIDNYIMDLADAIEEERAEADDPYASRELHKGMFIGQKER